ncbi:hypothetical protein H4582DRAFT_2014006 [Lactarius indigo]|nr:hypothetical protein H4582DRAFT_2014006 [Lactarius indigo]
MPSSRSQRALHFDAQFLMPSLFGFIVVPIDATVTCPGESVAMGINTHPRQSYTRDSSVHLFAQPGHSAGIK